jgi:hypothetical protein
MSFKVMYWLYLVIIIRLVPIMSLNIINRLVSIMLLNYCNGCTLSLVIRTVQ